MTKEDVEEYVEKEPIQETSELEDWIEPENTTNKIKHKLIKDIDIDDYEEEKNINKLR